MISQFTGQLLSLSAHFFSKFEHTFLIASISLAMSGGLAVLFRNVFITFLKLVNLSS